MSIKTELLLTLNLFTNNLTPGSAEVKALLGELESFGTIAEKALRKYRLSAKNNFLDYPEIVKQVKHLQAKQEGLADSKTGWGILQNFIKLYGRQQKPELHSVMEKTVNALGGWSYLCGSSSHMSDRANFYKIYETFYNDYLTEILYDRSTESSPQPPIK